MNAFQMMILNQEMRQWLLECYEEEHDQEVINDMSYDALKRTVNREYVGGIQAFANDVLSFQISGGDA